ncbi:glycine cleavage H-protein-domain-containing protein [Kockiozyma suomiensis]|uniref:glycine cleavage H-protein-domain-containing protein n=1 Tax=Kockiozyma suomiensis TaxID=1337062 RepID=UPI0033436013
MLLVSVTSRFSVLNTIKRQSVSVIRSSALVSRSFSSRSFSSRVSVRPSLSSSKTATSVFKSSGALRTFAAEPSDYPNSFLYTEEHEWVALEDTNIAVIGISSYASKSLGDIVYAELPAVGATVVSGDPVGAVESVKSASDIYSPVSGEIVEVNTMLEGKPGLINEDPYGKGWLCKIVLKDAAELDDLMTSKRYEIFISTGE